MAYLNTKDVYSLFDCGVANLHVTDIDALPRVENISGLDVYEWKALIDNGATKEFKHGIAFSSNPEHVPLIINNVLCKHNDDSVREISYKKIEVSNGDAFVTTDKYKSGE